MSDTLTESEIELRDARHNKRVYLYDQKGQVVCSIVEVLDDMQMLRTLRQESHEGLVAALEMVAQLEATCASLRETIASQQNAIHDLTFTYLRDTFRPTLVAQVY